MPLYMISQTLGSPMIIFDAVQNTIIKKIDVPGGATPNSDHSRRRLVKTSSNVSDARTSDALAAVS